jgi:hypothetical protein
MDMIGMFDRIPGKGNKVSLTGRYVRPVQARIAYVSF